MLRPGQLVVCVDATWFPPEPSPLALNKVYTVETVGFGIGVTPEMRIAAGDMVDLVEIKNPCERQSWDRGHTGFSADRFRPVDPKRLDVFRQHLAPVPA
ncbi:hypothetical protein NKG99_04000 [Mesorhizobium sp. M1409]|uniref:hypothetical protein n=1 Tax=Mesorhizobium sp. M1409 TaxID=2957100 RepID=UPI00333D660D